MNFEELCLLLKSLEKTRNTDAKKLKLQKAINQRRATVDPSAYPLLRLLLPELDSKRAPYGRNEAKLADFYFEALTLPKNSPDAVVLRNAHAKGAARNRYLNSRDQTVFAKTRPKNLPKAKILVLCGGKA